MTSPLWAEDRSMQQRNERLMGRECNQRRTGSLHEKDLCTCFSLWMENGLLGRKYTEQDKSKFVLGLNSSTVPSLTQACLSRGQLVLWPCGSYMPQTFLSYKRCFPALNKKAAHRRPLQKTSQYGHMQSPKGQTEFWAKSQPGQWIRACCTMCPKGREPSRIVHTHSISLTLHNGLPSPWLPKTKIGIIE